jgi:molecular chaperone GrpE
MQQDADKEQTPGGNAWSRRDAGTASDAKSRDQGKPEAPGVGNPDETDDEGVGQATAEGTTSPDPAAEARELQDKLLRTLAEMENLRRRHTRDLEDARKYAMAGFARDLLDVADNMRRAVAAVPDDARTGNELVKNLLEGVELTERTLLNAFERHGVKKVVPERGEKFDHNRHQAMFEVPTAELPPGHVADVMQTGWVISDRLLRPAMVGVTKAAPRPMPESEAANDAGDGRGKTVDTNA